MNHHTKFGANFSILDGIIVTFRYLRWRQSVILELLHHNIRTTHEVFSWVYISLSNFMLIRFIVLKIWRFDFFAELAWNAYSSPQNFGFWGSGPLKVISHHRHPKGTSLAGNALTCKFWYNPSTGATWARAEGIKKKEKRQGKKLTVANWMFAQTTHVDAAICGLACRVVFGR